MSVQAVRSTGSARFARAFAVLLALPTIASAASGTVSGTVREVDLDDFANQSFAKTYILEDDATRRIATLRGDGAVDLKSGAHVRGFASRLSAGELFVTADALAADPGAAKSATVVAGVQNTLVIVANFTDATVAVTPSDLQSLVFTDPNGSSIDALFRETSFGNVSLAGQVVGPYVIGYSSTSACNIAAWADAADAAATAAGANLANFPRRLYVMPSTAMSTCGADGAGQVGGSPSRAWVFNYTARDVYAHELGHNLGMAHAATLANQYGDASDDMSADGYALRHFNAPHTEQMGWMPAANVLTVTQSGTYTVAALELSPTQAPAPQILKIAKPDTGEFYYFSYRQPIGIDAGLRSAYWNRVHVHRYTGAYTADNTFLLQLLDDTSVFSDTTNAITVTQVSHASDRATVSIQLGSGGGTIATCQRAAPALTISPASQSAYAGASIAYAVTLANQDGAACAASTFALAAAIPSGWSGAVSPATVTLSPGTSASATLTVTSPSSAAAATYALRVDASDSASATHAASGGASETVLSATDTQAPTAPTGLVATLSKRTRVTLAWQASTDNVAVAGYEVWRNGVRVATTTTTGYAETLAAGTYSYAIVAYDAAGNRSAASASVSVVIKSR